MKLYSNDENYKLYHGSMLDMAEVVEPNSIDAILTDPPYELNFMNKEWDNTGIAFQKETWKKCYDVLKPGGHLLAFGGSRTFHRIACAIEDAGFEIRDTIMWIYGCYSADTQVLTNEGWKYFYDLNKREYILQWDKNTNKLSWVKPLNYFEYDIDDELKLFENRHISQLVTKNHKIAVSIKKRRKEYGDYELIDADSIQKSWNLKFPCAGELDGNIHEDDAYIIGWWLTDAWKHKDGKACMFSQSKLKTLDKLRNWFDSHNITYSEYIKKSNNPKHKDEHTFYVTGKIADKLLSQYPNRELSWEMLNWDKKSRELLLEGLMDGDGTYRKDEFAKTFWSKKQERCDIVQAICLSLNYRSCLNYKDNEISGVNFNTAHNSTETQTKHRKSNVKYCGKVYCLQTETGAFVVRRNGKSFISGNSGFPKSMNVGLAIDKKNDVESKVIGVKEHCKKDFKEGNLYAQDEANKNNTKCFGYGTEIIKQAQNEWAGWGTQLKPSYEPIIVCRKPCEGSIVDNVMKYGVGGINIDECRVETNDDLNGGAYTKNSNKSKENASNIFLGTTGKEYKQPDGRFPANTILTYDDSDFEEVCGGFPNSGNGNGNGAYSYRGVEYHNKDTSMFNGDKPQAPSNYNDSGSASRYFYCAKATKRDRNEGLDDFEERFQVNAEFRPNHMEKALEGDSGKPYGRYTPVKNFHPCVKPTNLLQYLVRLVTPKGGTVLDPFNGSGSTGKACMYENADRNANYKYIGIELTEEYLPISKARIEFAEKNPIMDYEFVNSSRKESKNKLELF